MIYSIISNEDIFFDFSIKNDITEFIPIKYGYLEVEKGKSRVKRVISTNLKDYLNSEYMPF